MAFGLSLNLMSADTRSIYSKDVSIGDDGEEDHHDGELVDQDHHEDQSADQEQQLVLYHAPQSQRQDQRATYSPPPPEELIRRIGAEAATLQKKMSAIQGEIEQLGASRAENYDKVSSHIAEVKKPIDDANAKAARQAELAEVVRAARSASDDE